MSDPLRYRVSPMVDRFRAITHVLKQEGASSLGSAGRKLRTAVDMLQRFDESGGDRHSARRNELLVNAAYLLSAYVIQREAIGLRNHQDLSAEFDLTPEIWNRVGAVR